MYEIVIRDGSTITSFVTYPFIVSLNGYTRGDTRCNIESYQHVTQKVINHKHSKEEKNSYLII